MDHLALETENLEAAVDDLKAKGVEFTEEIKVVRPGLRVVAPDNVLIELLEKSGIPTITVPQDTADTDTTLYRCFNNTKLQLYDKQKHQQIVDLFSKHFDAGRFIRAYGL